MNKNLIVSFLKPELQLKFVEEIRFNLINKDGHKISPILNDELVITKKALKNDEIRLNFNIPLSLWLLKSQIDVK